MEIEQIKNFINGEYFSYSKNTMDIINPNDAKKIGEVVLSEKEDVDYAVEVALKAQKEWGELNLKQRSKFFFKYLTLLETYKTELALCVKMENGKDMEDAYAEVDKAIELCEFACSIPQQPLTTLSEVSKGIICNEEKRALGVVASIAPFNFPVMVPHWTILNAIMMGNAMILKPSEITPISGMKIAELFKKAGFPNGLLNIVNGGKECVEAICDNKDIKAISFVGSTPIAKIVYKRATSNLKRALCLGGAKNFLILTPDAEPTMAVRDIIASFSGMNGQRCMAASVLVTVGDCNHIIEEIVSEVTKIKEESTLAPVISAQAVTTLEAYIVDAKEKGAEILVDGSNYKTQRNGYFFAPSIIDYGKDISMDEEEIFGPILEIVTVDSLEEAITLQNASPYGNGTSVFTQNGRVAEDAVKGLKAGMVGVNIGIPVPREPYSFGGIKESKFGYGDITGKTSIDFWSELIKVTTKYSGENKIDWMS